MLNAKFNPPIKEAVQVSPSPASLSPIFAPAEESVARQDHHLALRSLAGHSIGEPSVDPAANATAPNFSKSSCPI